ncbi:MAG: ATPase domain-containing protein [Acidobacteriaceae bacterium]
MASRKDKIAPLQEIHKSPTRIVGLDQIAGDGLPEGRPTLVCGSAGCGKTLLAVRIFK